MSNQLADIKKLMQYLEQLQTIHAIKEQELKELTQRIEYFRTDVIPGYIMSLGLSDFSLDDGLKIKIVTKYFGNISEERAEAAHKWLKENNQGSIVKDTVTLAFSSSLDDQVDEKVLKNFLIENEIGFDEKSAVHPQTLKAVLKTMVEDGKPFPYSLFGLHIAKEVVVEKPKQTK